MITPAAKAVEKPNTVKKTKPTMMLETTTATMVRKMTTMMMRKTRTTTTMRRKESDYLIVSNKLRLDASQMGSPVANRPHTPANHGNCSDSTPESMKMS